MCEHLLSALPLHGSDNLIAFLQRSAAALKPGGMLFVKENVCERGFILDSSDASVTRQACSSAWMCCLCGP